MFSSERLLVGNLVSAIKAPGGGGVAVKCDGTYKLSYEGDWNLFSVGTHAVRYEQQTHDVVHSYRPFLFAYIKGESDYTLRDLVMPSLLRTVRGVYCSACGGSDPVRQSSETCAHTTPVGWGTC